MSEAERVAKSLTKAGQEALDWVRPCSMIAVYRAGATEIEQAGLAEYRDKFLHITPLGLEVRALLEQQHDPNARAGCRWVDCP